MQTILSDPDYRTLVDLPSKISAVSNVSTQHRVKECPEKCSHVVPITHTMPTRNIPEATELGTSNYKGQNVVPMVSIIEGSTVLSHLQSLSQLEDVPEAQATDQGLILHCTY